MVQRSAISRRELLQRGVGAAALAMVPLPVACAFKRATAPRIVVVGAGLAGLTCAYDAAAPRARLRRLRGQPRADRRALLDLARLGRRPDRRARRRVHRLAPPADASAGASLRARAHRPLRGAQPRQPALLARRRAAPAPRACARARAWCSARLERVARRVGSYTAADHNAAGVAFDAITVKELLDETLDGRRRQPARAGYVWRPTWRASSASTPTGSAPSTSSSSTWRATPGADERYHVRGGNDQIVAGLAAAAA